MGEQDALAEGEPVLLWSLGDRRFAVPLAAALEVTAVAALTEGARGGSPMGHLDLRGASLPVFDARRLLGVDERQVVLSDRYLIVRVGQDRIALLVDSVHGIGVARSEPAGAADEAAGLQLARVDGDDGDPLVHIVDPGALIGAPA